jgi:DNA repair exonuclease SbcCD ATPase subunit
LIEQHKKHNDVEIAKKKKEKEESTNQVTTINKNIVLIQKHIDVLNKKVQDKLDVEKKSSKLIQLESKMESRLKKLDKDYKFYEEHQNCPTCKQEIDDTFRSSQIIGIDKTKGDLAVAIKDLESKIQETNNRYEEIQKTVKHIQEHNNEIVKHNSTISAIHSFISKLEKEIEELSSSTVRTEDEDTKLNELKTALATLIKNQQDLSVEKQYYELAGTLLKDTGIKTKIIKQYLPIINKYVNKYLKAMDFFVNFNLNENFEETIKSRYRDEFSYANFSEGEKMRIDLALLFTWRQIAKLKNSTNTNLLILDEVFDSSLDSVGTDEFLKLIQEMGQDTNIFVISHKGDQLFDKFRSVIKFEKKNNFSQVTK